MQGGFAIAGTVVGVGEDGGTMSFVILRDLRHVSNPFRAIVALIPTKLP